MKITIEGVQGEGKSLAAMALVAHLTKRKFAVDLFDEIDITAEHFGDPDNPMRAAIYIRQKAPK